MNKILTLNERFEILKSKSKTIKGFTELMKDLYSFRFNHPYYCGNTGLTDDEARHAILDDLNIERYESKNR
jgi:hypothetical protein